MRPSSEEGPGPEAVSRVTLPRGRGGAGPEAFVERPRDFAVSPAERDSARTSVAITASDLDE